MSTDELVLDSRPDPIRSGLHNRPERAEIEGQNQPCNDPRPDPRPCRQPHPPHPPSSRHGPSTASTVSVWATENNEAADLGRRLHTGSTESEHADVLRLFTFAPGADIELDGLALGERLDALTLDVRDMHEHIIASLTRDEAEASVYVEELHRALHNYYQLSLLHRTTFVAIRAVEGTPLRHRFLRSEQRELSRPRVTSRADRRRGTALSWPGCRDATCNVDGGRRLALDGAVADEHGAGGARGRAPRRCRPRRPCGA